MGEKQTRGGDLKFESKRRRALAALGLGRDATPAQIRASYRKLALAGHPDRHPGDEAKAARFREVAAAYAFLVRGSGDGRGDPPAADVEDEYARWWWDSFADVV
ncbi:MAG: J domain-containing protein [Chloroflexi bacterium]|nr:J domain-containing protein [Chloroflexota bacterium]MDA8217905.1 J domain-containing protein [Dehalococcoidales bacterium]